MMTSCPSSTARISSVNRFLASTILMSMIASIAINYGHINAQLRFESNCPITSASRRESRMRTEVCLALTVLWGGVAFSQASEKPPAFEIADIHTSTPLSNPTMKGPFLSSGRFEIRSANMVDLIRTAYGVDANKVVGGPNWLELDRFDVIAKVPDGAKPDTMKTMLRTLLADRFKLVVHNDNRPVPAYLLTAGKKPLMKPADGSGESGCKLQPAAAEAGPLQTYACRNLTMDQFAETIGTMPATIPSAFRAVDQTGL